jgi:hypothetical protein
MNTKLVRSGAASGMLRAPLVLIALALPAFAQLGIGVEGGLVHTFTQKAIAGTPWTNWGLDTTYGGSLDYRSSHGLTVGVRFGETELPAKAGGALVGTLKMEPLIGTVGFQSKPATKGFGFHCRMGLGVDLRPEFDNGPAVATVTQAKINNVTVSSSPWMEFSLGMDYFFSRHVSVTFDYRSLSGNAPLQWQVSQDGRTFTNYSYVFSGDPDRFYPSHGQVLGGIKFWLK